MEQETGPMSPCTRTMPHGQLAVGTLLEEEALVCSPTRLYLHPMSFKVNLMSSGSLSLNGSISHSMVSRAFSRALVSAAVLPAPDSPRSSPGTTKRRQGAVW